MKTLVIMDLKGKKANEIRTAVMNKIGFEDFELLQRVAKTTNPTFFTSRTVEEIIEYFKNDIDF